MYSNKTLLCIGCHGVRVRTLQDIRLRGIGDSCREEVFFRPFATSIAQLQLLVAIAI